MKVAVYRTLQYGPSMVFTLPADGEVPADAAIPNLPAGAVHRARSQWAAKGSERGWEDWAQVLAGQLPYFEHWSVEEVPDGMSATQALSQVRQDEAERVMEPAEKAS